MPLLTTGAGKFPAAGGGGGPAYTFRGTASDLTGTANPSYSIDIGTASADRLIIVGFICAGSAGAASVTVNGTGLTLAVSAAPAAVAEVWYGLVTSGSGTQTVQVNGASNFFERDIIVWAATGLSSNVVKQTASDNGTQNINVSASDFLFAINYTTGTPSNFDYSSSTESPTGIHTTAQSFGGDWTVISTNAAFSVAPAPTTGQASAAATFR